MSRLSSMELNKLQSANIINAAPSKRWAIGLLLLAIFGILYLTLFPFDFFAPQQISFVDLLHSFESDIFSYYVLSDFPRNVLLFVPFGFAFGLWRQQQTVWVVVVAACLGFMLSLGVEIVQAVFLLRFAAIADLLANTLGAVGGMVLYLVLGEWLQRGLTAVFQHRLARPTLFILALAYLGVLLVASYQLRQTVEPSNWDTQFPLLLGNEQTGDRPWAGELTTLYVADRALTTTETDRLLGGEPISTVAQHNLVAHYLPEAGKEVADQAGNLPDLIWQGEPSDDSTAFGNKQWLASATPVDYWTNQITQTGELTIGVVLKSNDLAQSGPARILSLSNDPFQRNFMLGQVGQDLVIRLRTPFTGENGRSPEFVIPNALADQETHHIIVSYGQTAVRVTIDSNQNSYQLPLSPAFTLFWTLPHAKAEQFRLGSSGHTIYTLLYSLLFILPLLTVAHLILRLPQASPVLKTRQVS